MFQSYLSKLFKKKPAEDTLVPPLWGTREKNIRFSSIICARCCTRRNLRFHVENCQQADPKTAHATIGLRSRHRSNPRPTRFVSGKAGECRSWPRRYQVDPWSRGREVARGVLRSSPKPEKRPPFCHRRRIENFGRQQRPNVCISDARPAPATYHRSFCEQCDQRVGRSP